MSITQYTGITYKSNPVAEGGRLLGISCNYAVMYTEYIAASETSSKLIKFLTISLKITTPQPYLIVSRPDEQTPTLATAPPPFLWTQQ